MKLNNVSFVHAKNQILRGNFVDSSEKIPMPSDENRLMEIQGIPELARWYLGIEENSHDIVLDATDTAFSDVRSRYEFAVGDLRKVYKGNLERIAKYAADQGNQDIADAAEHLLQLAESVSAERVQERVVEVDPSNDSSSSSREIRMDD